MPVTPLVSVIIPTFNRAHCIARSIESVLGQTFVDIEVIVIDDGSTDGTAEVLTPFGSRIRIIRCANGGVAAARNRGIRAARAKWIAFQDSDDVWHPEKLERQLRCLEKYGMKVCFSRCVAGNGDLFTDVEEIASTIIEPGIRRIDHSAALDSLSRAQYHPFIQSAVLDRELLEHSGLFDESLFAAEDTLLIFRLAFLAEFLYVDHPSVVIHRGTPGSLTFGRQIPTATRRYAAYTRVRAEIYWRLLEKHPEKAIHPRRGLAYFISIWAELACVSGQQSLARMLAWDSFVLAPDWRTRIRGAWIYLLPATFRMRFGKRWKEQG
jgi:glycosyltransferase involved in cell wall biosynthesis